MKGLNIKKMFIFEVNVEKIFNYIIFFSSDNIIYLRIL